MNRATKRLSGFLKNPDNVCQLKKVAMIGANLYTGAMHRNMRCSRSGSVMGPLQNQGVYSGSRNCGIEQGTEAKSLRGQKIIQRSIANVSISFLLSDISFSSSTNTLPIYYLNWSRPQPLVSVGYCSTIMIVVTKFDPIALAWYVPMIFVVTRIQ